MEKEKAERVAHAAAEAPLWGVAFLLMAGTLILYVIHGLAWLVGRMLRWG